MAILQQRAFVALFPCFNLGPFFKTKRLALAIKLTFLPENGPAAATVWPIRAAENDLFKKQEIEALFALPSIY
jgi:hypothetical protein